MTAFVENFFTFSYESIDRTPFFAYNIRMKVSTKGKKLRLALQIILSCLCVAWLAFIFGNSLRTGTQSSVQSSVAVRRVQKIFGWFAPNGWVANATGKDYLRLHKFIRKAAHFVEYAVLGGLFCWCFCSFTLRVKWSFIPLAGVVIVPTVDELLQTAVAGRAGAVADVFLDVLGGLTGFAFAALCVFVLVKIIQKRRK